MSINDGVLDDLTNQGQVDPEVASTATPDPSLPIPDVEQVEDDISSVFTKDEGALIQTTSEATALKSLIDSHEDLVAIEEMILGNGSISKSDAETLDAVVDGKLTIKFAIEEFTGLRTATHFTDVKKFLAKTKLSLEEEMVEAYMSYKVNISANLANWLANIKDFYLPYANDSLCKITAYDAEWMQKIQNDQNAIVLYEGEFQNILNLPIISLDLSKFELDGNKTFRISETALDVCKYLSSKSVFKEFVFSCNETSNFDITDLNKYQYAGRELTANDFINMLTTTNLLSFMSNIEARISESINKIQLEDAKTYEDCYTEIIEKSFGIDEGLNIFSLSHTVLISLGQLSDSVLHLLQEIKNMTETA